MRSSGQEWACSQLAEIADNADQSFELITAIEPDKHGEDLVVVVSVDCRGFTRREGGVRFKARERLRIEIPSAFPLSVPRLHFTHTRYRDCPHVQWGKTICLYQASDVEWNASRGMFGFMRRVNDWLKAAAEGELDPVGMPLHPPVAYNVGWVVVVPCQDAPEAVSPYWGGCVEITREQKHIIELGRWIERSEEMPESRLATAILLPGSMPHEYPKSMVELILTLMARDVPLTILRIIIELGVLRTPPGGRAFFVLGAAMRGIAGGRRLQHLACWRIDAEQTDKLRLAILQATPENPIDEEAFYAWAKVAQVEWCRVMEDRPEIVERRDSQSAAGWWLGKRVVLLGCGAIGSAVAMMLTRAGVSELRLFDRGVVSPGILVRQGFPRRHLGFTKATALEVLIKEVNPAIQSMTDVGNIVHVFQDEARLERILSADVIIDATASPSVAAGFEMHFRENAKTHPPVVTMAFGHHCDMALMTLASDDVPGMGLEVDRRAKLAFANASRGRQLLEEFWPSDPARRKMFQPEPGCSSPTFRGSYADALSLTARMMNIASRWMALPGGGGSRVFGMDLSGEATNGPAREIEFLFEPSVALKESRRGYEVRLSAQALTSMMSHVRRAERLHRDKTETGGVIFGQVDEFLQIVWIDEVGGPPPDSRASPSGFICGTAGVNAMHDEKFARSRGSTAFVGMWHTHPNAMPIPSRTDLSAMEMLMQDDDAYGGRNFLMLIVGGTASRPILSAGLYERAIHAQH